MKPLKLTLNGVWRSLYYGFRLRRSKQMQFCVVCKWMLCGVLFYAWISFNGGLWPKFTLRSPHNSAQLRVFDANLLDYFSIPNHDGILVTWAHAVNDLDALQKAFYGDTMMLEADVFLWNQDMPVIGHGSSNVKLSDWLTLVKGHGKAIKLDLKSIDAVQLTLRILAETRQELKVPVHLNAAVVDGSSDDRQVIDGDLFLRSVMDIFPECTLSLSWVTDSHSVRYNWTMVKSMFDLIDRWRVSQPVTFTVNASLVHQSMSQLRWLLEMVPGSTLTLASSEEINVDQFLFVRHQLPKYSIFYDIPQTSREKFISMKHDLSHSQLKQLSIEESQAFVASQWRVVRSRDGETIYLGTATVVLRTGLLITKAEYKAARRFPVSITGRVEFFNTSSVGKDPSSSASTEQGLVVFVRASQSSRPDSVSGVRCFFGVDGELRLELHRVPGHESSSSAVLPGTSPCIAFRITDRGTAGIEALAARPKSCYTNFAIDKNVDFEAKMKLSLDSVSIDGSYVAIKQSFPVGFIAVDKFSIHTQRMVKHPL